MMYRSGWATKLQQERILAIRMTREGFEDALSQACLSHYDPAVYPDHDTWRQLKSHRPVRVQWDPERDTDLNPLPWRTIQIGLTSTAACSYVNHWIVGINDVTRLAQSLAHSKHPDAGVWPIERVYTIAASIAQVVGMHTPSTNSDA